MSRDHIARPARELEDPGKDGRAREVYYNGRPHTQKFSESCVIRRISLPERNERTVWSAPGRRKMEEGSKKLFAGNKEIYGQRSHIGKNFPVLLFFVLRFCVLFPAPGQIRIVVGTAREATVEKFVLE